MIVLINSKFLTLPENEILKYFLQMASNHSTFSCMDSMLLQVIKSS